MAQSILGRRDDDTPWPVSAGLGREGKMDVVAGTQGVCPARSQEELVIELHYLLACYLLNVLNICPTTVNLPILVARLLFLVGPSSPRQRDS